MCDDIHAFLRASLEAIGSPCESDSRSARAAREDRVTLGVELLRRSTQIISISFLIVSRLHPLGRASMAHPMSNAAGGAEQCAPYLVSPPRHSDPASCWHKLHLRPDAPARRVEAAWHLPGGEPRGRYIKLAAGGRVPGRLDSQTRCRSFTSTDNNQCIVKGVDPEAGVTEQRECCVRCTVRLSDRSSARPLQGGVCGQSTFGNPSGWTHDRPRARALPLCTAPRLPPLSRARAARLPVCASTSRCRRYGEERRRTRSCASTPSRRGRVAVDANTRQRYPTHRQRRRSPTSRALGRVPYCVKIMVRTSAAGVPSHPIAMS